MEQVLSIASRISTPIALGGLFAAILFLVFRQILQMNVFPSLTTAHGFRVIKVIIDRLFVLAVLSMIFGFAGYALPYFISPGTDGGKATTSAFTIESSAVYKLVSQMNDAATDQERLTQFVKFAAANALKLRIAAELKDGLPDPTVQAKMLGVHAFVSIAVPRMVSYVAFIDARNTKLVLEDNEFAAGIEDIEFTGVNRQASPNAIVEIIYNSMYGTGTYAKSAKIYTITEDYVLLSLNKPYFEYNNGWGAFKSDDVEFKTKNIFELNQQKSVYEVRTIGVAIVRGSGTEKEGDVIQTREGGPVKAYRELPDEFYVWNPLSKQFEQKEGRIVAGQPLLTHVYSDFAGAKGGWFTKPAELKSKSKFDRLYERL